MHSQDEVVLVCCGKVYGETIYDFAIQKSNNDIFDDIQKH